MSRDDVVDHLVGYFRSQVFFYQFQASETVQMIKIRLGINHENHSQTDSETITYVIRGRAKNTTRRKVFSMMLNQNVTKGHENGIILYFVAKIFEFLSFPG